MAKLEPGEFLFSHTRKLSAIMPTWERQSTSQREAYAAAEAACIAKGRSEAEASYSAAINYMHAQAAGQCAHFLKVITERDEARAQLAALKPYHAWVREHGGVTIETLDDDVADFREEGWAKPIIAATDALRALLEKTPQDRTERTPVPADVHERGWQWRPTDEDTAFAPPFGTIRKCRVCDCLVAGGPTVCVRCAAEEPTP